MSVNCENSSVSFVMKYCPTSTVARTCEVYLCTKLTVPSAAPKHLSRSANPNHLKTGRMESNLRLCGECWQINSKFSSLMVMTKVPLLSLHSMPVHKFSASRIEEMVLENSVQTCPFWKRTVVCIYCTWFVCSWCFQWSVATGHLSSQRSQCVMAAVSPPRFSAAWRVEAPFSTVSRFDGFYTLYSLWLAAYDSLYECGRPCDTMSCLFCTAFGFSGANPYWCRRFSQRRRSTWLASRRAQSILPHAYKWSPCPWTGRWIRLQDSINPDLPPPLKTPTTNNNEALFQLPHAPVGDGTLFNHLKYYKVLQVGIHVALSVMEVCDVLLGTPGVSLDRFCPRRRTESSNSNIWGSSLTTTTSYVSRKYTEETSISRLFRCWLRDLGFLVPSFLETKMQGDRSYASTRIFCLRMLLWHTWSLAKAVTILWAYSLALDFVNVHFEPEVPLRRLRGSLRLITPHWPSYPNAVGIILGDFNICEPEEGRLNVWNQTFTDGDAGKTVMFHPFFPHVLEIAQLDYTRRDSTALGIIRTLSRIDRFFINLPMAEARDFHCYSHVFENLGNQTIPSAHAAVRLVIHKPSNREQQGKRIPCWMSKTSCLLFYSEAASRWPPIFCRSIWRTCGVQSYSWKGLKADSSWALTEETWQLGSKALNRLYCIACLQK